MGKFESRVCAFAPALVFCDERAHWRQSGALSISRIAVDADVEDDCLNDGIVSFTEGRQMTAEADNPEESNSSDPAPAAEPSEPQLDNWRDATSSRMKKIQSQRKKGVIDRFLAYRQGLGRMRKKK